MTDNTRSAPSEASEFWKWWIAAPNYTLKQTVARNAWNAALEAAAAIVDAEADGWKDSEGETDSSFLEGGYRALASEIRELEAK